jgi:hypothetical protein
MQQCTDVQLLCQPSPLLCMPVGAGSRPQQQQQQQQLLQDDFDDYTGYRSVPDIANSLVLVLFKGRHLSNHSTIPHYR